MINRYSRRKELTLFVVPHILNMLYVAAQRSNTLKPFLGIPHGFTLLFALSMTSVMHAYEREPQSLTMLINGILRFFFGTSSCSSDSDTKTKESKQQDGHDLTDGTPKQGGSGDETLLASNEDCPKPLHSRIKVADIIKILQ